MEIAFALENIWEIAFAVEQTFGDGFRIGANIGRWLLRWRTLGDGFRVGEHLEMAFDLEISFALER